MFTLRVAKAAVLLAAIVTGLVAPLAMLLASAPSGDEASEGLTDLSPTGTEIIETCPGVLLFFVVVFLVSAFVISRMYRKSSSR